MFSTFWLDFRGITRSLHIMNAIKFHYVQTDSRFSIITKQIRKDAIMFTFYRRIKKSERNFVTYPATLATINPNKDPHSAREAPFAEDGIVVESLAPLLRFR